MSLLVFGIFLFLAFLSAGFVWSFKKNAFMEQEAKRTIGSLCEVDDKWSLNGKIHTSGFTIIKENGENKFIKQAKPCDAGILS